MSTNQDKYIYKGMDIFKLVMALLIIVLHTHPFYGINERINFITADVLGRIAVPYFFAASGFLLAKKVSKNMTDTKEAVRGYICHILKLYLLWTVIYLPIIIVTKIIDCERGMKYAVFAVLRDFVFCGSYAHLWYLPATAAGVLLLFLLKRVMGFKKTGIVLLILFLAGLLAQSYFGLLAMVIEENGMIWNVLKAAKMIIVTSRNGVFFGGLFIYIGAAAADGDIHLKWKPYLSFTGAAISLVLLFFEEAWLLKIGFVREGDMYIMLIPTAFFLLTASLQVRVKGKTDFLRSVSMNMYFIHMIFKFLYRKFIGEYNENGMQLFLFTLGATLFSIFLIEICKYIIRNKLQDKNYK